MCVCVFFLKTLYLLCLKGKNGRVRAFFIFYFLVSSTPWTLWFHTHVWVHVDRKLTKSWFWWLYLRSSRTRQTSWLVLAHNLSRVLHQHHTLWSDQQMGVWKNPKLWYAVVAFCWNALDSPVSLEGKATANQNFSPWMMKRFYPDGCGHFQDDPAPIHGARGSLKSLMRME